MKVGQQVLALDLLTDKAHLAVARLVGVQISKADLEDTSTKAVSGDFGTGSAVDQGLANLALTSQIGKPIKTWVK